MELAISSSKDGKKYVQDIIKENKNSIYELVKEEKAVILVCANLIIEQSIREALVESFKSHESDPAGYVESLKSNGQYLKELWNY